MTPPEEQSRGGTDDPPAEAPPAEAPPAEAPPAEAPPAEAPRPPEPTAAVPEQRETLRGPHLPPVLLGLAALALAVVVLGQELTDLSVDWVGLGPLAIVAAGLVLVVLGGAGLARTGRGRRP